VKLVLMGVAGSGKTTVGLALAPLLAARYIDGDDLHPPANVAKMARGEPLQDADRWPWLDAVGAALTENSIIGCSALKRAYRDRIRRFAPDARFVHLTGSRAVIEARMAARTGHFMPLSLLDSQFAALEPPGPDEAAISVDIDRPTGAIVAAIRAALP
jgi:gluconokinase